MQSIWTGAINLGAMNVPIKLFPATPSESGASIPLKTLHMRCRKPVQQVKRCSHCGDDIRGPYDVVSGYEYTKGRFAIVKKDELPRPEADEKGMIAVEEFVRMVELDVWQFDRHYWITPDGAPRSFALFHRALLQTARAAIVRITLRTKSHLAVLYPRGPHLMLTTLYYADEIRSAEDLPPGADGIAVREQDFEGMCAMIDSLSNPYQPARYRDTHQDELRHLLAERVEEAVLADPEAAAEAPASIERIVSALKESVR